MGLYAETHFEIECEDEKSAKDVLNTLVALNKKKDVNGNSYGTKLEQAKEWIYGFESSSRIQNLEYRCEVMWGQIENIQGVVALNAPFLSEADGFYREKDVCNDCGDDLSENHNCINGK